MSEECLEINNFLIKIGLRHIKSCDAKYKERVRKPFSVSFLENVDFAQYMILNVVSPRTSY